MNIIIVKVIRDITFNKLKTLLIISTLFFGLLTIGIVSMFSFYFVPEVYKSYNNANPHDAVIKTSGFDEKFLDEIKTIKGIKNTAGRISVLVRLDTDSELLNTNLICISPNNEIDILKDKYNKNKIKIDKDNMIMIERAASKDIKKNPGEKIKIIINSKIREIIFSDYLYDPVTEPYTIEGDVIAYVNFNTFTALTGKTQYNEIIIKTNNDIKSREDILNVCRNIQNYAEIKGIRVDEINISNPGHFYASDAFDAISQIMSVIGTLSILFGIVLIINMVNSIMLKHYKQIGIMKSIGGNTGIISSMYLLMIFIISLFSFVLAMPVSAFLGYQICFNLSAILNIDLKEFTIPFEMIIIMITTGLILPLVVCLIPVFRITGKKVYDLLNNNIKGASFKNIIIVEYIVIFINNISMSFIISLRNIFRNRLRVVFTVFILIISGAIFVAGINLNFSFKKSIEDAHFLVPDGVLTLETFKDAKTIEKLAKQIKGVKLTEGWAFSQAGFIEDNKSSIKKVRLFGIKPESKIFDYKKADSKMISGKFLIDDNTNQIVITTHLTSFYPNIKIGDKITLKIVNKNIVFQVVGIMSVFGHPADPILFADYSFMNKILKDENQVCDLRFILYESTEEMQIKISREIENVLASEGIYIKEINLGEKMLEQFSISSSVAIILILVLSILITLIGVIGLSGTLSLNILEKTSEYGVLRAIGATNQKIFSLILRESLLIVIIAFLAGIIFSVPLTIIAGNMLGNALSGSPIKYEFGIISIVLCFCLSILSAFSSVIIPYRNIKTLVTREILVYE